MTREQQEMALWRCEYVRSTMRDAANRAAEADCAVEQFRQRYPAEPAADDKSDNAVATTLITLLDDIAGDSAFSGFGQSMQSRIYAAIEAMRKGLPVAPAPVWYDEPPFAKDGSVSPVWLFDYPFPILVAYFGDGWAYEVPGRSNRWHPLAGRRVCPIIKPQEPIT